MTPRLKNIIDRLDAAQPYVWRLRLTADEYREMEAYLLACPEKTAPSQDLARLAIIYLAEWYHRCYCGSTTAQTNAVHDMDCKTLWEASGFNISQYVYVADSGSRLWKYSIYVLGGLAVRHELSRGDSGRFLKALCRMLHGENYTLENLDDASRAMAFRQSIQKKHSLYAYLTEILNGKSESHDEETARLIEVIRKANDEVLRTKFAFEWIVTHSPSSSSMNVKLRLWLKPEEVGGLLHQYLRYDRLSLWGIPRPEQMGSIYFGLRWKDGERTVLDLNKRKALIAYSNTGNDFVFWSAEDRYALCCEVPVEKFTSIEIVAFDDAGHEWVAQTEETKTWLQLWRLDEGIDRWSSRQKAQHQTAVVYTDQWQADREPDERKPFRSKTFGTGKDWNWAYIPSDITLSSKTGERFTLYNRNGYDQVFTRLYKDTIRYHDGCLVKCLTEDEEEGTIEEYYPLIFQRADIRIHHFATKDDIAQARVETDEVCTEVEYKQDGRFLLWTEENEPPYGLVGLRVTEKGVEYKFTVVYLKGPVVRDFDHASIHYYNIDGTEATCQDNIALDGQQPLYPTTTITIANVEIEVYRPTLVKELYLDGRLHRYILDGEEFLLPYILKDRVRIVDFSRKGYKTYDCAQLGSLFATFGTELDNPELTCLKEYDSKAATALDANAPGWLRLSLSKASSASPKTFMKWRPETEPAPQPFRYEAGYKKQRGETFFIDMRCPDKDLSLDYVEAAPPAPFGIAKKSTDVALRCFLVAQTYQAYFCQFRSLRLIAHQGHTNEKLVAPLKARRGGTLTEEDIHGLRRFADEFQLDINQLHLNDNRI